MDLEQAKQVLSYMSATWPGELTDDRIAVWCETLADVKPGHAREAVRSLKSVKTFMPSHAEFFEAIEVILTREALQQAEIEAGRTGGDVCECAGNAWVEIDSTRQGVVKRCERCNPEPRTRDALGASIEHKKNCSCARCFYGPKRHAAIRAGRDGMGPRRSSSLEDLSNADRMNALRDSIAHVGTASIDEPF